VLLLFSLQLGSVLLGNLSIVLGLEGSSFSVLLLCIILVSFNLGLKLDLLVFDFLILLGLVLLLLN